MRRQIAANGKARPIARGIALPLALGLLAALILQTTAQAQGPALTTISDTVYRADGSAASGTVLISWPSFQTAEGDAVAAGNQIVTIGAGGAFMTQLVPNVGATPAGTYYTVVFQLDDGTVRTEYWAVPATSPTTISGVRTTPGTGLGNLAATQQYVNSAVANRALDATVVHLAGTETITGNKQFAVSPSLPQPVQSTDAASKGYVDTAVQNVGTGSYVLKAGDTMTGPLTLPGPPAAPNQAADRQYVDGGLSAKADLVSGLVPPNELGAGAASAGTCLNGNSTWGACGGGAPAGISYATTALNWTQTISGTLSSGTSATVTLSPCPAGIDTASGYGYQVLLSGGGNSEAASVTGGTCSSGATTGTVIFTPFYSYASGYTIGSASSGIQETINSACGIYSHPNYNGYCNIILPANGTAYSSYNVYNVYGTIYLHANNTTLSGYGTALACKGRGPCLQVGDLVSSNHFTNNTISGISFRTPTALTSNPSFAGVAVTQTQRTSQLITITTATPHGFRAGDMVTTLFTDSSAYWGDAVVTAVPSPTTFQYAHTGGDIAAQSTPGVVALAYEAALDNGMNTHWSDITYDLNGESGAFNNFFDFWDDENALVEHFNNNAIALNHNANWTGSFVFSAGNQGSLNQIAPVITMRDSNITANTSNGVTVYNSNGVYIENTVLQATGPWQVYVSTTTGNYQGAYLKNIYSESTTGANPLSPVYSPFAGTGIAGLIAGYSASTSSVTGNGTPLGAFQTGGSGTIPYSYFIVAHDMTTGTATSPLQVYNYLSTGSDSIAVRWPRVANATDIITYDVIRAKTPVSVGDTYPSLGNCPGGSTTACGSVATALAQCTGLVCSYTDSGSAVTASYTVDAPNGNGTYTGNLIFWPGSLVTVNKTVNVTSELAPAIGVGLNGYPAEAATVCTLNGGASPGGYTTCTSSMTNVPNQTATLMTDGAAAGGGMSLSKGRLNFSTTPAQSLQPHHIITLIDSTPALTRATVGYRAPANSNDVWIGTDVPSSAVALNQGQLAMGAPTYIDFYINNVGDNTNYLERLSSALKTFNVPVQFNNNVTMGSNLMLPQGNGYVPAPGGIGLDTTAGLPVVNLHGTTYQLAFTSSNISGQAGTALALAGTPTQCSGSFATGIAANGNANCTTPNVIQLSETTPPAGIPNWGVFWFDSASHTPRVIENGGQPMQLGLTNLFNSDPNGDPADNLEERNGGNAQNLRIYSNYGTNGTTWTRMSLGYDTTSGYQVLRSEDATSGNALGLGMYIGLGLKWAFAANGGLKPYIDNAYDIGTDTGQAMRSVFAKTSFNLYTQGRQDFEYTDGGTAANMLAVYNSAGTAAQMSSTSNTDGVIGVVSGYSTSSPAKAIITWAGYVSCNFDASSPTLGDYVVASTTQAGKCHDAGATRPTGVQVIGRVESSGVRVSLAAPSGTSGGGEVSSVFGRTGTVMAASGDYSVSQVTGAAVDAAVVHLAGTETITGSKTFSSDVTLSGNLNVAGNINQTGSSATQWSGKKWSGTTATVPSGMDFSLGIGSDSTLKCQLASGGSCMPAGSGAVTSVFTRTGAVVAATGDYTVAQITGAAPLASPIFTGTPTAPTISAGDNSTKLATTAYVKSESYFTWTCPVAGSTSVSQNCNWTLPVGVTITGFDFAANTAPVGCTTYPTFQVWDGTAGVEVGSYSISLTSGQNFPGQAAGSANVAATHQLRIKVTTAAAGCTTNAGGMVATVTYQMQN